MTPVCVASNGNTLYAVISSGYGDSEVVILARSNVAPSSLEALTWTAIASTYQKSLTTISGNPTNPNVDCHVDNQGVFTFMSMFSKSPMDRPSGYQYNPTTKTWTNIATSPGYKWGSAAGKALFTVNGSSSTLMHIYKGTALNSSNVAVYNPKTRIIAEGSKPLITSGSVEQYAAANGSVYLTSYDISTGAVYLNIGAVGANGVPPLSTKVVNLNIGTCIVYGNGAKTVLREGLYYLYCGNTDLMTFRWFTYDGVKQSASSPAITNARRSAQGFLPLGRAGKPATWAFMYDPLGLASVTLTGPKAGEWRDAKYTFNISGTIPKPKPVSAKRFTPLGSEIGTGAGTKIFSRAVGGMESHGGIETDGPGSGGLSTGALAGIVGSAVVVLGVVVIGVWRRRKTQSK
ncbi:hypothetical protein BGZ95_008050 [Linnemannia exigua]|uniref:Uncharacterized protein n=1 Tax=Linnemannia exigua TaxID=604196 RepID=A0AAD4DEH4_9FUNG|nr:hypothetical protein BGZ95_008050 [Linnemannia exigua]